VDAGVPVLVVVAVVVVGRVGPFVLRPVIGWHFVGFLIFSDYGRNPPRLAAIMEVAVVHDFIHDPIALGAGGAAHQPIERKVGLTVEQAVAAEPQQLRQRRSS
jgi:hypothetical protein